MTRQQALRLAEKHGQPIVVPNRWGRFDYALPGGIVAQAATKAEVAADFLACGYDDFLIAQTEYFTPCPTTNTVQEARP